MRLITNESYLAHTYPLFFKTKILRLPDIHTFISAQMCFHSDLIRSNSPVHSHFTRFRNNIRSDFQRLSVCQHSIFYNLPFVWNNLPNEIKSIEKFKKFKLAVKTHLVSSYISS